MKVSVSVHGRWHAFDLAAGLFRRGLFSQLTTTYPRMIARRFVPDDMRIISAPLLEFRRRLYDRFKLGQKPDLPVAESFGRFTARHLEDQSDVLVGWSSATLEAIDIARSMGKKIVIERGSSHIVHQKKVLGEVYEKLAMKFSGPDPGIVEREIEEYRLADAIAVPTKFAADTFELNGVERSKLFINPYGVDLTKFNPGQTTGKSGKPQIVFVGGVGARKGVPHLLNAFKSLAADAELHLVGPVETGLESALANINAGSNIKIHGPVASNSIPDILNSADIFCLPSLEEGFPLSMLQAMSSGLPVVTTKEAGAEDILSDGEEGKIVPAGDEEALADALALLISDQDLRISMGQAARARVENGYSWDDYIERSIDAYEKLTT